MHNTYICKNIWGVSCRVQGRTTESSKGAEGPLSQAPFPSARPATAPVDREFIIDNLLVRNHYIIVMIR